ncbi:unnamed protein product [Trichogramma brassicae]|uniref:Uncharacterized protein n=1 Tax=Trichogramma brassicae TaxID=86971 RepID=A0A6H5IQH8_9HYME|nr:unnamed protein product [Trichogramma brassicae]
MGHEAQAEFAEIIKELCDAIRSQPRADWTLGRIRARGELLEEYWSDFQRNHVDLPTDDPERRGLDRNVYISVQAAYIEAKSILYDAQAGFETLERRQSDTVAARRDGPASTQSRSRLPQIHVPAFSGRREDWESFRDLFSALIHNDETLSNVERLYYLKTLVKGEASSALSALQLTDDSYTTAWSLLESRFENRRLLVQDHLSALRSLKPIREDSVKAIQHLMDTLGRHRDQLRTLDRPVDAWDDWFVSIAASCMDGSTRKAWEAELERLDAADQQGSSRKGDHLASFATLTDFLGSRCRMAAACASSAFSTSKPPASTGVDRSALSWGPLHRSLHRLRKVGAARETSSSRSIPALFQLLAAWPRRSYVSISVNVPALPCRTPHPAARRPFETPRIISRQRRPVEASTHNARYL